MENKFHAYVSFIKSFIRIIGFFFLLQWKIQEAGTLLMLAEFLGILEELPIKK